MQDAEDRTANWLVGDRLAAVLHLGDGSLAYQLAELGHEVVVAGDDVRSARHAEIGYVVTGGERLPFAGDAFDAVVVPELADSPSVLAEYARVLRPEGVVATSSQRYDDAIPWLRRLREVIGDRSPARTYVDTFAASGLFDDPEVLAQGSWVTLDLPALLRFARTHRHPSVGDEVLADVQRLFDEYARQTGFLRLRRDLLAVRARVDKAELPPAAPPPETLLLDFR